MTGSLAMLGFGLGLLIVGGEFFVSGALRLSGCLRVSSWATGATLIAFATSAPELAVGLLAARQGHTALAFGNVVGSNLANAGLILGLAATLRPLPLGSHPHERRLLGLTIGVVLILALEALWRGAVATIGWPEACALLAGFAYYTSGLLRQGPPKAAGPRAGWLSGSVYATCGLATLGAGGELAVRGATGAANHLALSPALIGLSAVAIGTSLPELFASVAALRRNEGALLLGTILGSNLLNLLLVLSATALVHPIPFPPGGTYDLLIVAGFSAMLLTGGQGDHRLTRARGLALFVTYLGYLGIRFVIGT